MIQGPKHTISRFTTASPNSPHIFARNIVFWPLTHVQNEDDLFKGKGQNTRDIRGLMYTGGVTYLMQVYAPVAQWTLQHTATHCNMFIYVCDKLMHICDLPHAGTCASRSTAKTILAMIDAL